jgi:hypothetical protein
MVSWNVKVSKTDGTVESFPVTPRVIVAFERNFKTGLANAFANEQKLEHVYWLAWEAERVSGKVVKMFDEYLDTVAGVELETVSPSVGTL